MVEADARGIPSHGVNRLDLYCDELRRGCVDPAAVPEVVSDAAAVALVNGKNAQGPVVGKFCMDLAIEKAKTVGCAWVVCNNSNHYGIAVRLHFNDSQSSKQIDNFELHAAGMVCNDGFSTRNDWHVNDRTSFEWTS